MIETCKTCGCGLPYGAETECLDCQDVETQGQFDHGIIIRCPRCRETWQAESENVRHCEMNETCPKCEKQFVVQVNYEVTYISPEMEQQADNE